MAGKLEDLVPRRTDGKRTPIPRSDRPLKNVVSREEVFRQMREEIAKNPALAKGMKPRHKKILGLK